MHYSKNTTKGMTLIESIVSIVILTTAITGPMILASQSLKASRDARAELVATHLAEEAIEVVSSIRENNSADDPTATRDLWMKQNGVQNIINLCGGNGCVIDVTSRVGSEWGLGALIPTSSCTPGGYDCSQVYVSSSSGLYRQFGSALPSSSWEKTPYKRSVKIVGVDAGVNSLQHVRVVSTVTYPSFTGNIYSVTLNEDFYNWFPALH